MPNSGSLWSFEAQPAAELLKAFSHPTRLMILEQLLAGPNCVTNMEDLLPARQANISQHLAILRHARLVDYAQDGALRCYYLCRPRLVRDMLRLLGRPEPLVKRTPEQIRADKRRLERASARASKKAPGRASCDRVVSAGVPRQRPRIPVEAQDNGH
jgi:ArsR family transcriptional regulator